MQSEKEIKASGFNLLSESLALAVALVSVLFVLVICESVAWTLDLVALERHMVKQAQTKSILLPPPSPVYSKPANLDFWSLILKLYWGICKTMEIQLGPQLN